MSVAAIEGSLRPTSADVHPIAVRAARLRARYGGEGLTVYDRHDRWVEEHSQCAPDAHIAHVELYVYIIRCTELGAVAVCESWQFTANSPQSSDDDNVRRIQSALPRR